MSRKLMRKKGFLGDQVNWVYVLVAGSLILIFLISIVYKQKLSSDEARDREVMRIIELLTTQQPRSTQLVHVPDTELDIKCDGGVMSLSTGSSTAKPYEPIFGSMVKSDEIITLTEEWNAPYRATNFIYLIGNDTRFIIVHDASSKDSAQELYKALPEQANKKLVAFGENIPLSKTRKTVIIGMGLNPPVPEWLTDKERQTAIRIDLNPRTESGPNSPRQQFAENGGEAIFCSRISNSYKCDISKVSFAGRPMLMGITYSDDKKSFACRMDKAFERLKSVSKVYENRAKILDAYQKAECSGMYDVSNTVSKLAEAKQVTPIDEMRTLMAATESQNRALLLASCPTIY